MIGETFLSRGDARETVLVSNLRQDRAIEPLNALEIVIERHEMRAAIDG